MSSNDYNKIDDPMEIPSRQGANPTPALTISDDIGSVDLDNTTECGVLQDESKASISSNSHMEPAEHDNDLVSEHDKPSLSVISGSSANLGSQPHVLEKKVGVKKRTMQENAQLQNAVLNLYQQGHPPDAIALMCEVQLTTVQKVIVNLLSIGKLPSCPPKYTVLGGGKYIKDIVSLSITKADYVSITPTADDDGVIIKPFNINGVNHEQ